MVCICNTKMNLNQQQQQLIVHIDNELFWLCS